MNTNLGTTTEDTFTFTIEQKEELKFSTASKDSVLIASNFIVCWTR